MSDPGYRPPRDLAEARAAADAGVLEWREDWRSDEPLAWEGINGYVSPGEFARRPQGYRVPSDFAAATPPGERTEECSDPTKIAAHRAEWGPGSVQRRWRDDDHWITSGRIGPALVRDDLDSGWIYRLVHPEPPTPAPLPPGDDEPRLTEQLRTVYKVECRRCGHFNSDLSEPHAVMRKAADLIDRLRRAADTSTSGGGEWHQLAHRCREAADFIEATAAAPVLPPGVTLPDEAKRWGTLADGRPIVCSTGHVPDGWEKDDVGMTIVGSRGRTLWAVRPPEPPAEPRTERVPWWEAFETKRPLIDLGGEPINDVCLACDTVRVRSLDGKRHHVAEDGKVRVLALGDSDD